MAIEHQISSKKDICEVDDDNPFDEEFRTSDTLFAKKAGPDIYAESWFTMAIECSREKLKCLTQDPDEKLISRSSWKEIVVGRMRNEDELKEFHKFRVCQAT
jgi:hypothetical protein